MILAIDPGCIESAYVLLGENLKPVEFGKVTNYKILDVIERFYKENHWAYSHTVVEMVASYGMPVGEEVFETCLWIGRFIQKSRGLANKIYRKDEKMNLCHSMKATDANITQALVDRFAYGAPNKGKGTKKNPGWFYGVSKDVWAAIAVGVTYHDLCIKGAA